MAVGVEAAFVRVAVGVMEGVSGVVVGEANAVLVTLVGAFAVGVASGMFAGAGVIWAGWIAIGRQAWRKITTSPR